MTTIIDRIREIEKGLDNYSDSFDFLFDTESAPTAEIWRELFKFIEQHPLSDFGAPGSIVHYIETAYPMYFDDLMGSVERSPSLTGLWMMNRIANAPDSKDQLNSILELMRKIANDTKCDTVIREDAKNFADKH